MRKRADDEALLAKRMQAKKDADRSGASTTKDGKLGSPTSPTSSSGEGSRNWFQRKKDQLVGTKEERAKAKAEKRRIRAEQERKAEVCFCFSVGGSELTIRNNTKRIKRGVRSSCRNS